MPGKKLTPICITTKLTLTKSGKNSAKLESIASVKIAILTQSMLDASAYFNILKNIMKLAHQIN